MFKSLQITGITSVQLGKTNQVALHAQFTQLEAYISNNHEMT